LRSLGAIALTCVGVLVLVGTLDLMEFALTVSSGTFGGSGVTVLWSVLAWLAVAVTIAIGVGLVRKRHALASRWFDDSPPPVAIDPESVLRLALIILGVVQVTRAIPALVSVIPSGFEQSSDLHWSWAWGHSLLYSIAPLAHLVIGGLLLAYSQRLAHRLWTPTDEPAIGGLLVGYSQRLAHRLRTQTDEPATPQSEPVTAVCTECGTPYDPSGYRDDASQWTCDSCGWSLRRHA
jgi:hypothetical protein